MKNLMNEKEALEKAYDSLIETYEICIDECKEKYNKQLHRNALLKISKDLEEHGCNIGLEFKETFYIPELENNMKEYEKMIESIKQSKERLIK